MCKVSQGAGNANGGGAEMALFAALRSPALPKARKREGMTMTLHEP